ncbi:MAG: class I SAM-dependent methyltransferase [Arenicella sp.]
MNMKIEITSDNGCIECPLCHGLQSTYQTSKDIETVHSNVEKFADHAFTIWRCKSCNSLHSKESVDLDYYYKNYPMQSQKLDYGTKCAFNTRLSYLKQAGLQPGDKVLDYGCSNGLFVEFLQQKGYRAFGYDPYLEKYANESILNDKYDLVVSYDVIEHVDNPKEFVPQMSSYLKAKGILVIGTPNASEIKLDDKETYALELHQPYHRHILSEGVLCQLGTDNGFTLFTLRKRFCFDTKYPFINAQFIWRYVRTAGNFMDCVVDMPKFSVIRKRPSLILWGLIGYLFPHRGTMVAVFKKEEPQD